jgi:drug/metabolite transporter (DMT)-like permease
MAKSYGNDPTERAKAKAIARFSGPLVTIGSLLCSLIALGRGRGDGPMWSWILLILLTMIGAGLGMTATWWGYRGKTHANR